MEGFPHSNPKLSRVFLHILFWTGYVVFFVLQYAFFYKDTDYLSTAGRLTLEAFIDMGATYFTVYFLLPRFLFKRKYVQFVVIFFLSAIVFILIQRVLLYYYTYPRFFPDIMKKGERFWHINPFYSFLNIYTVVGLFASIKLMKYWYKNQQIKTELENKNKTSELALLRSQLNPHFLFNTLNNIDSLIMSNPGKASDAIIKLSDILRFMLYDTSTDVVPLEKEISYLKSYISLQQIRLKDPAFVKVDINGNCSDKTIAPMLFIPFVENAFKHGRKNVAAPGIRIRLECQDDSIFFEVANHSGLPSGLNKDRTAGIGMANTRRRLELLYPGRHKLSFEKKDGMYISRLTIRS